ncbi:hypothetical protein H0H92_013118, partial [Tricholoma furcatifolium]
PRLLHSTTASDAKAFLPHKQSPRLSKTRAFRLCIGRPLAPMGPLEHLDQNLQRIHDGFEQTTCDGNSTRDRQYQVECRYGDFESELAMEGV